MIQKSAICYYLNKRFNKERIQTTEHSSFSCLPSHSSTQSCLPEEERFSYSETGSAAQIVFRILDSAFK